MPMLIALLLLIVQSLAPQPAAAPAVAHRGLVASATMANARSAADDASAARSTERSVRGQDSRHATVWLRAPQIVVHVATSRVASTPPTLPPGEARSVCICAEEAFAASVRVGTLDDSHAVSARGALLPYYPTAPPLQG
jgi:hypothetical protein